jgi:inner membrane transporter RhtA
MNVCFYLAIDRLPLGTVAAIEFLPVIALAALGARTLRNGSALLLAVGGVYLLTDVRLEGEPVGVALAFANAVLFAVYIVLGHRVAQGEQVSGIDGLAASMLVALVVVTPLGGWEAGPAFADPLALLAGIGVGISSSVIPYVCDQLAMARLPRATYALLVSLLPATATVIGVVVLAQVPSAVEAVGVGLVVGAVALHRDKSPERAGEPELVQDGLRLGGIEPAPPPAAGELVQGRGAHARPGLPAVRVEPAREVLLRPEEDHRASGERDVVPPAARRNDEVDEQVAPFHQLAVANLELERLAAVRALGADGAVRVQRPGDTEGVPGAVREPAAAVRFDAMRGLDGRERIEHTDLRRAGPEHERVSLVEAPVRGLGLVEP